MPTILLATLGASWQVIPEVVAALAPSRCALYAEHPQPALLAEIREQCAVHDIDQLWIVTSDSTRTLSGLQSITEWNSLLHTPLTIRIFIASGTTEVRSPEELALLRELIFRTALLATEAGAVVCSLAGGRKTMSADLQRAASLFGTKGLLHIVGPEGVNADHPLGTKNPVFWTSPLQAQIAATLMPAFVGRYSRRETMDTLWENKTAVCSKRFPLPAAETRSHRVQWHQFTGDGLSLVNEAEQREQDAQQLLSNYLAQIAGSEKHENWRHLYRLAPADIDHLRMTKLNTSHRELIRSLPKAELHCHLGGLPDLPAQQRVGAAIWTQMNHDERARATQAIGHLLALKYWPWDWPAESLSRTLPFHERTERAAALLILASAQQLQQNLYLCTEPRVGLKQSAHGFSAYERPGELTGSSVLGHPAALAAYADAVRAYTSLESIRYLELRGSPQKYSADPIAWLKSFREHLPDDSHCTYRFIWIADRRQDNTAETVLKATSALADSLLKEFLVGLDLAGDENAAQPHEIAVGFLPAFEHCLPISIHAGEGESAENIWQAAYHLHADRIGHGLTLADNPELLQRFRNRGICLELCPSSNREVIGFADPAFPASAHCPPYPLLTLWESGIALTINTDNPGISRTTLTEEFMSAARMSELSLWDTLAIIKQSFVHAMSNAQSREALLKQCDSDIFSIITQWLRRAEVSPK